MHDQGRTNDAERVYLQLLVDHPRAIQPLLRLSSLSQAIGELNLALDYAIRATALDPHHEAAVLKQIRLLRRTRNFPELKEFEAFCRLLTDNVPDSVQVKQLLAEELFIRGNGETAIDILGSHYGVMKDHFLASLSNIGREGNDQTSASTKPKLKPWQARLILSQEFVSLHGSDTRSFIALHAERADIALRDDINWFFDLKNESCTATQSEDIGLGCMADVCFMLRERQPRIFNPLTGALSVDVLSILPDMLLLRDTAENVFVSCNPLLIASNTLETTYILPERRLIINILSRKGSEQLVHHLLLPDLLHVVNDDFQLAQFVSDTPRSTTIALADRPIVHLGHQVWNKLSSWSTLLKTGLYRNADCLASWEKNNFFGSVFDLYPEFEESEIEAQRLANLDQAVALIQSRKAFWLPMFDRYVRSNLATRIISYCRQEVTPEFLSLSDRIRLSDKPVLLMTIRLGNRVWVDQEEGFVNIIKAVHRCFPGSIFILDGMNEIQESNSTHKYMDISAELSVSKAITRALPKGIEIFNTIGMPIANSIVLCEEIDAFIAPWGTAMTKYKWITNKPGVALGNKISADPNTVLPGTRVFDGFRDDQIPAVDIALKHITDVGYGNLEDPLRQNFSIPWQVVFDSIYTLLLSLGFLPEESSES